VIGNAIYQPSSDGNVYVVNLSTGVISNTIEIGNDPLWAQPATNPTCGCIYIASMDHNVYSFDTGTGKQIWKTAEDLGGSIVGKPAVGVDGTLFVGTFGSQMVALDGTTGRVKWRFATKDWIWAGPALDNSILYFGDLTGNFYAINASDSTAVWAPIKPNNSIVDTPVISGTNVYLTTEADSMYTINTSGAIMNTTVVGGVIYAAPLISGDKILIAPTGLGNTLLVALNLENPNAGQKWAFTPVK